MSAKNLHHWLVHLVDKNVSGTVIIGTKLKRFDDDAFKLSEKLKKESSVTHWDNPQVTHVSYLGYGTQKEFNLLD